MQPTYIAKQTPLKNVQRRIINFKSGLYQNVPSFKKAIFFFYN